MSRTDTHTELEKFYAGVEGQTRRARRRWVIGGAVAATAAAVGAFALWSVDLGENRSLPQPAVPDQTAEEKVAQGFVDAYAAGDADQAASYLAPDATLSAGFGLVVPGRDGWRHDLDLAQAWSLEYSVQPCQELASIPAGTKIACLYDVNALHSEQLRLGPFTNNAFTVLVKNGQIVEVRNSSNHENNGLADHVESIAGWIRENHPGDHAFMFKADHTKAETQRLYRLWEQHSQEYADAMTQEWGSGSAP